MDNANNAAADALVPRSLVVPIRGADVAVGQYTLRTLTPATRHIRAILPHVPDLENVDILALIEHCTDDAAALIALATGRPRAWVDDLTPDEALDLLGGVLQVNAEMLAKKLPAAMQRMVARVQTVATSLPQG